MVLPRKTRATLEIALVTSLAYLVLHFANVNEISAARIHSTQRFITKKMKRNMWVKSNFINLVPLKYIF